MASPRPGVSSPQYKKALSEFSTYFQRIHRIAGEPTYKEVSRRLGVSEASVHRYLNGVILPRWQFVAKYLDKYARELGQGHDYDCELKDRWMITRNVLKPIDSTENAA